MVVYRLITVNTIDEKILERASAKRKLEKMVIHKSKFITGQLKLFFFKRQKFNKTFCPGHEARKCLNLNMLLETVVMEEEFNQVLKLAGVRNCNLAFQPFF